MTERGKICYYASEILELMIARSGEVKNDIDRTKCAAILKQVFEKIKEDKAI